MPDPLAAGELCLLVDTRGRQYLVELEDGGAFHSHAGFVEHAEIIGAAEGSHLKTSTGAGLTVFRPRLADFVLRMRRGAQIIYPKDIGPILLWADIGPGHTVLEAGTGSGALTLALVRAVGSHGKVVSVERRRDHAVHGRRQIERFLGEIPANLDLRVGDVEMVVEEVGPDRLVLDVPEPWLAIPAAMTGLASGGIVCSYLPTVPQIQQLADALYRTGRFTEPEVFETLRREWSVSGRSVRPAHRMVGHTGFLVVARRLATPADPSGSESARNRA